MAPVYPKTLRAHGYGRELDVLLDANSDPHDARMPAAAERLARYVLLYGTYEEAPALISAWLEHADALSLVAPFGLPGEQNHRHHRGDQQARAGRVTCARTARRP